jgi:uncharacterized membrane protein
VTKEDSDSEELTLPRGIYRWVLLGIALVFVGLLVIVVASLVFNSGSGSIGVVIFIGPIPIVFGSGPDKYWLILIGVIITIISLIAFLVMNRRYKRV